uniref:Transmembrane protein 255B n=1 Tax=Poecilia mexicana TaxID=48701 RepID=A0A3B3Z330_9TELE
MKLIISLLRVNIAVALTNGTSLDILLYSSCLSGLYVRRGKTALWVTVSLLMVALVVLTVGLVSATRTDNVSVSGYYPGITLSFGAFLGIVGIHLVENRRPMLVAAIIFISIGVITSFLCAIVDGIIDIRPLEENMCDYYSSGSGYAYDNYYTEVACRPFNKACSLRIRSNTCYCCYLYCESSEYHSHYYEFTGVSSCFDAIHLYRLLWASVVLNVIAMFLGIINAAILGAYKDMVRSSFKILMMQTSVLIYPCASTPHPLQPDPAHALLLGLLPLRAGSARLPKLPHTHAGTKA